MDDRAAPNPYTGLNGRGFPEGRYQHEAVRERVREDVRRALPDGRELVFLDFWYDASNASNPLVRMITRDTGTLEERTDHITVPENGVSGPWAGMTGPTLVAWVEATFGG